MRKLTTRTIVLASALFFCLCMLVLVGLYQWSLTPADRNATQQIRVVIKKGDSVSRIGEKLKEVGLIRSVQTFRIYSELTGTKARLQAGAYAISKNLSVGEIIDRMSTGKTDEIDVTILPGKTLADLKKDLEAKGFSGTEIDAAFSSTYDVPILAEKPLDQDLEGYIFPETYRISAGDDVKVLIEQSLQQMQKVVTENDLKNRFHNKNLSVHQGLTLASIVQKEAPEPQTQKQVAQVFLKRLSIDMLLQSDTTFIYPAKKAGKTPSVDYDSPYNTYIHKGLPPGPIQNFNLSAMLAIADPAPGDYLYFLADKDGNTYFAHTAEEHAANVKKYCTDHCNNF